MSIQLTCPLWIIVSHGFNITVNMTMQTKTAIHFHQLMEWTAVSKQARKRVVRVAKGSDGGGEDLAMEVVVVVVNASSHTGMRRSTLTRFSFQHTMRSPR